MECLSREEIEEMLKKCLHLLLDNDKYLFEKDVNERSISHMLAFYLKSKEFKEWDVDCEYNRDRHETKKLDSIYNMLEEIGKYDLIRNTEGITVFPDIIVHKRGTDNNLLVIEIKKCTSSKVRDDFDIAKLKAFRADKDYRFAVFLKFKIGNTDEVGWEEMRWY